MFSIFKKKVIPVQSAATATPPAGGCGTCTTKSAGACSSHLEAVAEHIAAAFARNSVSFSSTNPQHLTVAEQIMKGMKDAQGNPLGIDMPTDPRIRQQFLQQIATAQPR